MDTATPTPADVARDAFLAACTTRARLFGRLRHRGVPCEDIAAAAGLLPRDVDRAASMPTGRPYTARPITAAEADAARQAHRARSEAFDAYQAACEG